MRETEIKYCYKKGERPLITSFLKKNRYTQKYQVYEKDTYYTYKDRNFLKEDIALRVRKVQKESVPIQWKLTYKGPNMTSGGQDREELELQITENGDSLSKLLENLGFTVLAEVEKKRLCYTKDSVNICLDEVNSLGSYIEIEILSEDADGKSAYASIDQIMKSMELADVVPEYKTYLELILFPAK